MRQPIKLAILLIVPFFLTGCGLRKDTVKSPTKTSPTPGSSAPAVTDPSDTTTTPVTTNYLGVDPSTLDSQIKANLQAAASKVLAWKKDAVLYNFSAKFTSDLKVGLVTEVYTYGSPTDAYNWWTYSVSGKTSKAVRAIIPKEDYLGTSLQPIPIRFWKINYIEALQLAEANGGSDFRANHPDSEVTATLAVGAPKNFLWWVVSYESASSDPFKILVNPATKEVFDEAGKSLTGNEATTSTPSPSATVSPTVKASPAVSDEGVTDETITP